MATLAGFIDAFEREEQAVWVLCINGLHRHKGRVLHPPRAANEFRMLPVQKFLHFPWRRRDAIPGGNQRATGYRSRIRHGAAGADGAGDGVRGGEAVRGEQREI